MSIDRIPDAISKKDVTYSPLPETDNIYTHPGSSNKLVRWSEHVYDHLDIVYPLQDHLENLERVYGIPNVHPQFALSESPLAPASRFTAVRPEYSDIVAVVDNIEDGTTLESLMESNELNEEKVQEYDFLAQRLIAHLRDTYVYGGLFCTDFYHYNQYLYSESAPAGKRLILVDIEPIGLNVLPEPASRLPGGVPLQLIRAIVNFTEEVAELEHYTGTKLAASSELIELLELIESEGLSVVEEARLNALQLLDAHEPEVVDYFRQSTKKPEDDNDEEYNPLLETMSLYSIDQCIRIEEYLEMNGNTW